MLKQCRKCVHYVFAGKSLNYDLGACNRFKTFAIVARLDETQCGKDARHFKPTCLQTTTMLKEW